MKNTKRVSLVNLGCKVNQYELEKIASILPETTFSTTFGLSVADIYVVNTCAVTNEGERKSRNMLTKILKLNPNAQIYVAGCASQNNPKHFENANVKYVIGTADKNRVAYEICKNCGVTPKKAHTKSARTRNVLKCQDGCNNFCTYCIIPYLRGREVSTPICELKQELANMMEDGAKEVVLTGINLSSYGNDLSDGTSFVDLAKMFENLPVRYRFSSLEVNVITDELLNYLKSQPNFCPHFHLSLQSGCDKTLKDMNRHYTSKIYLQKVNLIRKYFPDCAITTDVIVGFPTETEEDFNQSVETILKANFADIHAFIYSNRTGTVASKMKNIATNVKERAKILAEIKQNCIFNYAKSCENKIYDVIVEAPKGEYLTGHTPNYVLCYFKGNFNSNDTIKVKIIKPYADGALAEVIK